LAMRAAKCQRRSDSSTGVMDALCLRLPENSTATFGQCPM